MLVNALKAGCLHILYGNVSLYHSTLLAQILLDHLENPRSIKNIAYHMFSYNLFLDHVKIIK